MLTLYLFNIVNSVSLNYTVLIVNPSQFKLMVIPLKLISNFLTIITDSY